MQVERVWTPRFEVREGTPDGTYVTLDATPPVGHALGIVDYDGTTYYFMDLRVDPTEDDGARWAAVQQRS